MGPDGLFSVDPEPDASTPWLDLGVAEPPCTLDVQVTQDHELEFHFDAEGHVSQVVCSCGRAGTVEML